MAHGFHPYAMRRAAQPPQLGADIQAPGDEVQVPPTGDVATSDLIGGGGRVAAQRADQLAPAEGDGDDHRPGQELVGDPDVGEWFFSFMLRNPPDYPADRNLAACVSAIRSFIDRSKVTTGSSWTPMVIPVEARGASAAGRSRR